MSTSPPPSSFFIATCCSWANSRSLSSTQFLPPLICPTVPIFSSSAPMLLPPKSSLSLLYTSPPVYSQYPFWGETLFKGSPPREGFSPEKGFPQRGSFFFLHLCLKVVFLIMS